MIPQLDSFVIVKPEHYSGFNEPSTKAILKADQQVLGLLEKIVTAGEDQLRKKTGFSNEHLPSTSPAVCKYTLDDMEIEVTSTVKRINPEYQVAFDRLTGFLDFLLDDWKDGIRKYRVRTYHDKEHPKEPFVRLDYLLSNVYRFLGDVTELKVEQKIETWAPPEYDDITTHLVIPLKLIARDTGLFSIDEPGAAKLWYQAKKFKDDVLENTVKPYKEKALENAGVSETKDETREHFEQIAGKYLIRVQSVPSPRRLAGKAMNTMFEIPEIQREEGVLPQVITNLNYRQLLDEYEPNLRNKKGDLRSVKNIGELILVHYGLEHDPKVLDAGINLQAYRAQRQDGQIYVSIPAVYTKLGQLENELIRDRMLHNLDIMHLAQ